jgi:predicted GTPase
MSQDFGSLQQRLKKQSVDLTMETKLLAEGVITLLDGKLAQSTIELKESLVTLESELKRFHEVVDHPEIIFATTGTTSSGKSTLVNLLCGAFIMPEAVGEMSAGVVEIEHGEQTSVEIFQTQGASWNIGRYENLSDDELQGLLTRVMHTYNDRREDPNVPECPRVKVTYPTRLGREISSFGLPPNTNFSLKILDLPGLKHVSDSQNAEVINSYCKRAMSFVTYNAAETDAHKQESLLKQVVGQVKEIGGTPARMMFILNRFDVYEQDSNPEESKARAFNTTQSKIREVLSRELPEYRAEAQAITPVKLATKPALLIERGEFKEIERFYGYIVDGDVMDELPRKVEKWSEKDQRVFADAVLKGCYVREFRELLQEHVYQHLPQILFPSPLAELKEKGLEHLLYKTDQQIQTIMETAKGDHQKSIHDLEVLEQSMQRNYTEFATIYHSITQLNPTDIPVTFTETFSLVEELGNRLTPLAKFTDITEMVINTIVDAVIDILVDGAVLF